MQILKLINYIYSSDEILVNNDIFRMQLICLEAVIKYILLSKEDTDTTRMLRDRLHDIISQESKVIFVITNIIGLYISEKTLYFMIVY